MEQRRRKHAGAAGGAGYSALEKTRTKVHKGTAKARVAARVRES